MSKQKKYHFIYKTTNVLTGRYYYGMHSTDNLNDGYLGSGKRLRYSIRKYGEENHKREILEFCKNRKELIKRESEIVNLNEIAKEECLNLMNGGTGGYSKNNFGGYDGRYKGRVNANKIISERILNDKEFNKFFRKRCSEGQKRFYEEGGVGGFFNKKHTDETKKLMSISHTGKHMGKLNSQYGTCWINNSIIEKNIKKEYLDEFLNQGWIRGRKTKF